jgi:hypothetical protein
MKLILPAFLLLSSIAAAVVATTTVCAPKTLRASVQTFIATSSIPALSTLYYDASQQRSRTDVFTYIVGQGDVVSRVYADASGSWIYNIHAGLCQRQNSDSFERLCWKSSSAYGTVGSQQVNYLSSSMNTASALATADNVPLSIMKLDSSFNVVSYSLLRNVSLTLGDDLKALFQLPTACH